MILLISFLTFGSITVVVFSSNAIRNQTITESQLAIEKGRVNNIDKQLANVYRKLYEQSESPVSQNYIKNEVNFLREQREEAVKNIDNINNSPEGFLNIYALALFTLILSLVGFFVAAFKGNITIAKADNKNSMPKYDDNTAFINWVNDYGLLENHKGRLDVDSAKNLKALIEIAKLDPEKESLFLNSLIEFGENFYSASSNGKKEVIDILPDYYSETQTRLKNESSRMSIQALICLFICFIMAIIFTVYIGYSIFNDSTRNIKDIYSLVQYTLPKLTGTVGFLTIFIYFINMYKSNTIDSKYYQNEITSSELRYVSLEAVMRSNKTDLIDKIVEQFLVLDRNRIPNKDSVSLDIERMKVENELNKSYLDKIFDFKGYKDLIDIRTEK